MISLGRMKEQKEKQPDLKVYNESIIYHFFCLQIDFLVTRSLSITTIFNHRAIEKVKMVYACKYNCLN